MKSFTKLDYDLLYSEWENYTPSAEDDEEKPSWPDYLADHLREMFE